MRNRLLPLVLVVAAVTAIPGCAGSGSAPVAKSGGGADAAPASATVSTGGAQLWAENCSRCHNIRPPQSYSDAQWEAVVMHMRMRANLTGAEQRTITQFLQASH